MAEGNPPKKTDSPEISDAPVDQQDPELVEEFLEGEALAVEFDWFLLGDFLLMMMACAVLAYLLERVYKHCGFSLSNRSDFSRNFVLLSCATMMIVTIVKSSLALSLGLVGALSIVRFRAAIKEPEELCFLFLAIGLGLGFGASVGGGLLTPEPYIPIVSFVFLSGVLWLRKRFIKRDISGDYHLLVSTTEPASITQEKVYEILEGNSRDVELKRMDVSQEVMELSYQVSFVDPDQLATCQNSLLALGKSVSLSMMDNRGVGN